VIYIADDNVVAVWDSRTGDELCAFNVFTDPQRPIAFDRDGKSFACYNVTSGFGIDIIDADTFEVIHTIPTQSLYVRGTWDGETPGENALLTFSASVP
jgi:hypothetical protein